MLDRKVGALGGRNCSYHQVLAANILGAVRSPSLSLCLFLLETGNTCQSCSSLTNLLRLVNLVSTFKQCRRFIKKKRLAGFRSCSPFILVISEKKKMEQK